MQFRFFLAMGTDFQRMAGYPPPVEMPPRQAEALPAPREEKPELHAGTGGRGRPATRSLVRHGATGRNRSSVTTTARKAPARPDPNQVLPGGYSFTAGIDFESPTLLDLRV